MVGEKIYLVERVWENSKERNFLAAFFDQRSALEKRDLLTANEPEFRFAVRSIISEDKPRSECCFNCGKRPEDCLND